MILKKFVMCLVDIFLEFFDYIGIINILYYSGDKPYKKYAGDAGYDLFVSKYVTILPHHGVDVSVNTKVYSRRMWLLLIGRSSTFFNKGLSVNTAVIDRDYTGDLNMYTYNMTDSNVDLFVGDRIGQVIPFNVKNLLLIRKNIKCSSGRGDNGFGSTGGGIC